MTVDDIARIRRDDPAATVIVHGEVRPDLVFRPAWSPEMMSEDAKAALGVF